VLQIEAGWSSASTCNTDTTKHHPQQTPTYNEKRTR